MANTPIEKSEDESEIIYSVDFKEEGKLEREEWIYTFADMVTLVLCFFIILFASHNPNKLKFEAISLSFRGGPPASPYMFSGGDNILEEVAETIKASKLLEDAGITVDDRGISVQLGESLLFQQGSAILNNEAEEIISKFAFLIQAIPNSIIIEGYTDPSFKKNVYYRNAWELSSARAARVIDQLERFGISPKRMELASYGGTRPRVIGNDAMSISINNRVEILIRPDDGPLN